MSKPNTIPRNYQLQLLEYAKNQNIVTVLNTGSGKTLIAVLLLKYIHSIDSRVSVFLVPAVPLVSQQSKYIQSHTTLNVQEAYGSMGVDTWDSEKWQAVTHLNNILVMTPQVLLNSIHSNFLNLNDISCLVFDEAHHCRGSHPYNQLMEVYRHHKGTRPKIFGMTASPSCSGSDCLESLKNLEQNLESKAYSIDIDESEELQKCVPRPTEDVIFYNLGPFFPLPTHYSTFVDLGGHDIPLVSNLLSSVLNQCDEFGPWWGDRALELAYKTIEKNCKNSIEADLKLVERKRRHFQIDREDGEIYPSEEVDSVINQPLSVYFNKLKQSIHDVISIKEYTQVEDSMVSPKLLKVFEILESYETNPDFCGIIFLEKRSSCTILADMIRNRKSLSFINPGILVGHGGGTGNSIKMISREQEITVKRFRQGSINLLIATKIGEEGIDIPKCLLVVRLTLFQNLIDYIQSRGRARKMESRYIVLLEENDEKALKHYQDTLAKENEMNASMANRTDEDEETSSAFILSEDEIFVIPSSGSRLTIYSALSLLYRYCSMLPKDIYCNSTPICTTTSSNEMFQSTFHLPSTVPKECRRITGTQSPSKKRSKLNAAFQCVKKLWEFGELDSRFRPIHLKVDENGKILPSIRRIGATTVRSFHPCIPLAFQGDWTTNQVYLSIISICLVDSLKPSYKVDANIPVLNSKTFKLGIITQNRIQSDSDVFKFGLPVREEGGHLGVELTNSGPIQVDDLSIIKFRVFHSKTMGAFFRIPLKPEFDYAYFIAPVIDGNLDYSVLDDVYGKVEISVFDHLKFKGILAEFVALVESSGVSEEADESMDVHNSVVNESEPVISMDVQNTDTIMCADAIQSIKQSGDSFESESVEIKGNVFEPAADSMMHQLKEPSINPNEETSTRSNSEIKVQKTSNDGTTEMNIDTLKESTKDKPAEFVLPPVPDVSTPYEGSLLEYINSKIRTSEQIKEDCIVTDHFYYGRHYRILEIIDSMTPFDEFENEKLKKQFKNFKTVADFYKIRLKCWETIIKDQPVIKAAVIPQFSQPARLIAKYGEGVADQRNIDLPPLRSQIQPPPVYLLPQFCRVYPVSKQILCEEAYHIPMIVRQLDHAVRVSEFKSDFKFDFVDTMKLQEALTAPSSHQPYDYERLENLGDSFLKILISLHLFSSNPSFHEGRLTSERNILEGNRNFTSRAVKSGILNIILTESLTKTLWSPLMRCSVERDANMKENDLFFAPKDSDDEPIAADDPSTILEDAPVSSEPTIQVSAQTSVVSDNTIADCMEAVIGSCILAAGINAGSYAASRLLNPNFQANWNIGYGKMLREAGYYSEPETVMTPELLSSLEFVESCIDYKFKNRKLLIEALTHPSMTLTKPTETCYPRLEFLGDAILHFIITIYIYSRYPLLSPGAISEYRSSLVCNQFLSIVCAHLKIHDHIIHASTTFKISMNEFTNIMKDSPPFAHKLGDRNDVLDYSPEIDVASMKRQTGAFWNEFEKAPKAIADVYESILGAVFVDSLDLDSECVFDLSVITSVIEKTLLLPWLPILGPPSSVQIHPVKALIDYVATLYSEVTATFKCSVMFHDLVIGEDEGVTKRSARKSACAKAVIYSKDNILELSDICTCTEIVENLDVLNQEAEEDC